MPDTRPVLLLDVDGVLNAVTDSDPKTWGDWQVDRANGFGIRWSPSMIAALTRLSERVELRWLTTWWSMTDRLAFLGLPPMEVANTRDEYLARDGWWKLAVAQRVYAEGRRVIWIDDDLGYDRDALAWGKSVPHGTLLGISPVTFRGLEPAHITAIDEWLDEVVTPSQADRRPDAPSMASSAPTPTATSDLAASAPDPAVDVASPTPADDGGHA